MFLHQRILIVICFLSLVPIIINGIKVTEDTNELLPKATATTTTTTTRQPSGYRVSRPKSKHATQRVPAYLQDIRQGFVDDDAGDVIHIIEPPQHFQQLKRFIQQKGEGSAWLMQPPPPPVVTNAVTSVKYQHGPQKPLLTKVEPTPTEQAKSESDLLTQETQMAQAQAQSIVTKNRLQLPLEILASVRKTERLMHQRQRPQLPLVRQRLITKQTHTLLAEKAHEQQQYQRAKEQRLRAALVAQMQMQSQHKRNKRTRREARTTTTTRRGSTYDVEQGLKLVAHIGELLRNAAMYLPDEVEQNQTSVDNRSLRQAAQANATKCGKACDKSSVPNAKLNSTQQQQNNFRNDANATTTITSTEQTTTTTKTTTTASTTSATLTAKKRRFGERKHETFLSSTLMNSSKSPHLNQKNHKKWQSPPPQLRRRSATATPTKRSGKASGTGGKTDRKLALAATDGAATFTTASAEVLYDDVMANIRNMLHANPLPTARQLSPSDSAAESSSPQGNEKTTSASANATLSMDRLADVRDLDQYLKAVKVVSGKLPNFQATVPPSLNDSDALRHSEVTFNLEEYARLKPKTNFYLINGKGKIYDTPLQATTKAKAEIFHSFPDIPDAVLKAKAANQSGAYDEGDFDF